MILNKEESESLDYILEHRNELFSEANKKLIELSKEIKKMKTFDRKDVFTIATAEDAKKYVGKLGYPSNSLNKLKQLINYFAPYSLDKIELDNDKPFFYREDGFLFFLPADKVKEIEEPKKWRAFETIEEFRKALNNIDFGQPLQFRYKENINEVYVATFNGYQEKENVLETISLGGWLFSPETLFGCYEVYNDKTEEWQPFGVLENES